MRTTLRIDDDVLRLAQSLARAENRSIGDVISELARRGFQANRPTRRRRGFPVFDVSSDASTITPEMVAEAGEEP